MSNTPAPATPLTAAELSAPEALFLPFQQRFVADTARVRVWEKTRRCGATWSVAAQCVTEAASGHQDVTMLAVTEENAKQFMRDIAWWAEVMHVSAAPFELDLVEYDEDGKPITIRTMGVSFPGSAKKITALASNPRGLRGRSGLCVVDEAAFHDDLDEVLKAAIAYLMWGGEVVIVSTHNGSDSAFAQLCNDIRDGKKPGYSLHTTTISAALEEGLYKRICAARGIAWSAEAEVKWLAELEADYGPDKAREELHVQPIGSGEAYLSRKLIESCEVDAPVLRYTKTNAFMELSEEERERDVDAWICDHLAPLLEGIARSKDFECMSLGVDVGRVADLSVIAVMGTRQNMSRRVPMLVEMANTPFNQQWAVLRHIMRGLPCLMFTGVDAGGNGSWLAEQAWIEGGGDEERVERVQLTVGYYRDNFPALRRVMEERRIEIPRDLDVRADLSMVRRISGVPRIPDVRQAAQTGPGRRHGDAAIALLLANAAATKAENVTVRWRALCNLGSAFG